MTSISSLFVRRSGPPRVSHDFCLQASNGDCGSIVAQLWSSVAQHGSLFGRCKDLATRYAGGLAIEKLFQSDAMGIPCTCGYVVARVDLLAVTGARSKDAQVYHIEHLLRAS